MGRWDTIVIGSGLGGLTAAALLAKAGQRVLVLERNTGIGGAATTFMRDGRRIEASLHETTPPDAELEPKGQVFKALGLLERVELVPLDSFQQVRGGLVGAPLTLPHGLEKIEAALVERFPVAEAGIKSLLGRIRRTREALSAFSVAHDGAWWLGHAADLPLDLWALVRDMGSSLSEVMARDLGDAEGAKLALTANLPYFTDDPGSFWWLAFAIAQGGYFTDGGAYIRGGSGRLTKALADIVSEEGGAVHTECHVVKVEQDDGGRASGVVWTDTEGTEHRAEADAVVANCAPEALSAMVLPEAREALMAPFAGRAHSISLFTVTYLLDRPGRELGMDAYSTAILPDWMMRLEDFRVAGSLLSGPPRDRLPPIVVVDYGQVEAGLGEGPAPISVTGVDALRNWEGLEGAELEARKHAWIDAIAKRLDAEWPGFADAVTSAEMATARTMARFMGTPGGAVYGFSPDVPKKPFRGPPMDVVSAVPGLYLSSAWAGFGGYSGAMGTGATAARAVLRRALPD